MAVGSGASITADYSQVRELLRDVTDARNALNALDSNRGVKGYSPAGTRMERELRSQVRIMAGRVIVPAIVAAGHATGNPLDGRMADTARAVNDRLPVVKVGKVNPKLSGFKRTKNRTYARGQLGYGSEYGPLGGARKGKHRGLGVNYYGKPRADRGYWITYAVGSARVTRGIIQGYSAVVDAVFDKWAWGPRRVG